MKINTIGSRLLISEDGSSYVKYTDIKSFPDLGGTPEQIDVTTLEATMKQYINGVQEVDAMEFESDCDSDLANYTAMKAKENTLLYYQVVLGHTGKSAFFQGTHSVHITGGEVNGAISMVTSIAPATDITINTTIEPAA